MRKGTPVARIVLPADADEAVALAAEELVLYVQKMSQARLTVASEPAPDTAVINLGPPDEEWAAEAKLASLTFDGFVVEARDKRLVLAGNVPEGTLNAVVR